MTFLAAVTAFILFMYAVELWDQRCAKREWDAEGPEA